MSSWWPRAYCGRDACRLAQQEIVGKMESDLPVGNVKTLRGTIGKSAIDSQFDSILVLTFAAIALLLAAGLYGGLADLVTQRTSAAGLKFRAKAC